MKLRSRDVLAVALAAGVAARLALLFFPLAATDVAYYNAQAASFLLRGVDPYGAAYSVPANLATPGAENLFAYLPGVFLFLIPGGAVSLVACDAVVALALFCLPSPRRALWSAAFLLLPPFILFSTSFPNDALPAAAFAVAAVAMEARGRHPPAAVLWGLCFASSQEGWFLFPFYAAYSFRSRRFAELAGSLGVAALVVLPFLAWDPGAFVKDTLLFQLGRSPVAVISPGPFGVNVNPALQGILASLGTSAPLLVRGAGAAAVLAFLLWRGDRTLGSLLAYGSLFAAAALWFLSAEFFWSYLELPLILAFAWYALRQTGERSSMLKETGQG